MRKNFCRLVSCLLFLLIVRQASGQQISLAGSWRFAVDRNNTGLTEQWFAKKLEESIQLPGTMTENKKGDDVTLQTK